MAFKKKREQIKDQILIELQICHVKLFIPNYHLEQTDIIKIYFQFAGLGLGDNSRPYNNYNSKYTIILQLSWSVLWNSLWGLILKFMQFIVEHLYNITSTTCYSEFLSRIFQSWTSFIKISFYSNPKMFSFNFRYLLTVYCLYGVFLH